jgi:hypothetical protein
MKLPKGWIYCLTDLIVNTRLHAIPELRLNLVLPEEVLLYFGVNRLGDRD